MRKVLTSKTFDRQFVDLLDAGSSRYSETLLDAKRRQVFHVLETVIARFPAIKRRHPRPSLVAYPISSTPFIVLYDFDVAEVRVHFIVHKSADLQALEGTSADW